MNVLHRLEFPIPHNQTLTVQAGKNLSFAVRQNKSANSVPRHKHAYDEILFSPTGINSIDWWCENSGNRSFVLQAGDIIWTPHGVEHSATWNTAWYNIGIALAPHVVAEACSRIEIEIPTKVSKFSSSNELQKLISVCLTSRGKTILCLESVADSMANVIAAAAVYDYKLQKPLFGAALSSGFDDEQRSTIQTFIASNICKKVQVAELASCLKLSPFHFARLFKDSFGVTPHEYVTAVRLERVCSLLTHSDLSMHQISLKTGFSDSDHLCKVFKKKYGITPSTYKSRQIHQQ